jgi:hypothetical protein
MSQNPLIDILEANRLLRSADEVARFEQTLAQLAERPDPADLLSLHLILDDACQQPEVMFSLVHFLESFEVQQQVQAFIQVMPELVQRAAEWTAILQAWILNDETARAVFETKLGLMSVSNRDQLTRNLQLR